MPGPGGFGRGGGFRGGGGFGRGFGRGFGWGPRFGGPLFGPGPGPLGLVGALATGAAIAAVVGPPPHRRYPPPPAGYIYVVQEPQSGQVGHAPPRAVRAAETPFIIMRVALASYRTGQGGEVLFEVQITMNDGYKYGVLRRYSQFDQLRERVSRVIRTTTPPFPPKSSIRSSTVGLGPADLEERRQMLQAWLQSLCTAASANTPALRVPLYDFLETAMYYPPEAPVTSSDPTAASAQHTAVATPAATTATTGVPVAAAYAEALPPAAGTKGVGVPSAGPLPPKPDSTGYGWAVPPESRDASDLKMAMAGPSAAGKLTGEQAAVALRTGTGAGQEDLRAVWALSDIDQDGMLDRDEFAVAWYLAHQAAAGNKPPASLPADIVPPSKRQAAQHSLANPFG
ncbi:similar to intersectin 2 [Ectocarpus siliculosus]|uniref:Similar to intersectin 2 n=1 Tax=Ectocarpus siliculosus TaxID=2880 RepID=D8LSX2_ECTSI|nr:similar to intersectin 2 [Ectocarpus siliculosus]|eukprot:CBN77899.1 similar to intersectin 2 [Ectocarpus siliculosus]